MSSQLLGVTFDVGDPADAARFWGGLLQREALPEARGWRVPGEDAQLTIRFVDGPAAPEEVGRAHLHLTSADLADQHRVVTTALGLGARHLDVGQRPEDGHVVLTDPEGTAFCVIEPGNTYLAGCGFLAELACDGTREVGLFWRDALG